MEVVTTSEAVRQFQMHPATVLRLILTQRVTAHKDPNGKWLVRRSDLERWNSRRVRKAAPSAKQTDPVVAEVSA
jgi:hypothetical protein